MDKDELISKLNSLEFNFNQDKETIKLISKLEKRFDKLFDESFTKKEARSDEFEEIREEYYNSLRECDPDDITIFSVIWLK